MRFPLPRFLRRRLAFQIRHEHFEELGIEVPLSHGCVAPAARAEALCSLSEIFIDGEYDPLLGRFPLPGRWLDLGCHAGYFSLWLEWRRRREGAGTPGQALLIDGDARQRPGVERMILRNSLSGHRFIHGAIAAGSGVLRFSEAAYMSSSIARDGASGVEVPIVDEERLMAALPPPYDLVKIDIEGGETHFPGHYPRVLAGARRIVLEWHSWHECGDGAAGLLARFGKAGFGRVTELKPPVVVGEGRSVGVCLLEREAA
jgi:FkbM family methyltransferase